MLFRSPVLYSRPKVESVTEKRFELAPAPPDPALRPIAETPGLPRVLLIGDSTTRELAWDMARLLLQFFGFPPRRSTRRAPSRWCRSRADARVRAQASSRSQAARPAPMIATSMTASFGPRRYRHLNGILFLTNPIRFM